MNASSPSFSKGMALQPPASPRAKARSSSPVAAIGRRLARAAAFSGILLSASFPESARAWGNLGHRLVSETASRLLESESSLGAFGPFISRHRFELGLYSTLPDTAFRSRDGAGGKVEAPSHFFDLDHWIPDSLQGPEREKALQGFRVPWEEHLARHEKADSHFHGSLPWRAEQLRVRAFQSVSGLARFPDGYQAKAPSAESDPDLQRLYEWLWWAGVLAHYTGDATVPYHGSSDYNGFESGQGGIHFYFEVDCVQELLPKIEVAVLEKARALLERARSSPPRTRDESTLISQTLRTLEQGLPIKHRINAVDRKKAVLHLAARGSRTFADRKAPRAACGAFEKHLIERLALGAVLTAQAWQQTLPPAVIQLSLPASEQKNAEKPATKKPGPLYFAEPRWVFDYPPPPEAPPSKTKAP
jgi:hypothetical protein